MSITEHSDTWFTQDVVVPDQLKLRRYSPGSSKSSGESSTSSLELEVSRLAQALRRIQAPTNITAVDYSQSRARFYSDLDGSNLQSFLAAGRPEWSAVRWIVVDGVSGDVLQTLAEHYDLHPLAIEDVINFQRIKCISYPGHMYVAAHVWQLQKVKGFATAAAAAAAGGLASEFDTSAHSAARQQAVHTHPVTAQQQQEEAAGVHFPQAAAAMAGNHSSSRSNHHQHQQGAADECRLFVGPDAAAVGLKSNNNSRRPGTADLSHGATDDLAAELLDTESDTSSLISSLLESDEDVHGGRDELEYESDDEVEDKRVNAREKLGGSVFATHPGARWLAGFRGKGAAEQRQQPEQQQQQEQQQQHEGAVRLNKKLLEKLQQQHQQQHAGPDARPLLGTELPAEAAAAPGDSAGIQTAAAGDDEAADNAAEPADTAAADAGDTHAEHSHRQQLLGNDADMEAATGAGALAGYFAEGATCTACASTVRLVVPLHSSAFNYRPTRSIMRRRRLMMQQVSMFLHSTGVLITIFPGRAAGGGSAAAKIAGPIMRGIRGMSSLLLESECAGFLLQALLRSCMSYSLPVFGRLADVLSRLDARVLEGRAQMKLTRRLHVLLIDLSILARSFQPMESLLQALATSSSSIHYIGQGPAAAAACNRTLRGSSSSSSSSESDGGGRVEVNNRIVSVSSSSRGLRRRGSGHSSAPQGLAPDQSAAAGGSADHHSHHKAQQQHQQQQAALALQPLRPQQQQQQQDAPAVQLNPQACSRPGKAKGSKHSTSTSSSSSSSGSSGGDDPVIISALAATYLEDLLDQALDIAGDLSAMRDHVVRLNELVVTTVGHANNNANLALALLSTVFLPLTWIAGIYGMNFDELPELHWKYGYAYFYLLSIAVVTLALLLMVYMRLIKVKEPAWLRNVRRALKRFRRRLLPGKRAHGLHLKLGSAAGRRKKFN